MQAHPAPRTLLTPPVHPVCVIGTYFLNMTHIRTQVSSVIIVSGYGLYDRAIEVRSLAEATSNLCPDWLWVPPSLLYNGYQGPFPGGKAQLRHDADH
jgi:hypothetical protein